MTRVLFSRDCGTLTLVDLVQAALNFQRDAETKGCPNDTEVRLYAGDVLGRGYFVGFRVEWEEE